MKPPRFPSALLSVALLLTATAQAQNLSAIEIGRASCRERV